MEMQVENSIMEVHSGNYRVEIAKWEMSKSKPQWKCILEPHNINCIVEKHGANCKVEMYNWNCIVEMHYTMHNGIHMQFNL